MKTIITIVVLHVLFVASLVNAAPNETIKMQLSWKHQFQFAGYYAALEKGFYKAEGLDVELVEGGVGTVCTEDVLSNQVQYCNGPGSVVKRRLDGEAIVAIASFIQFSPIVLITLKRSGLSTIRDLIGKRVETLSGGVPSLEIKAMFNSDDVVLGQLDNRENSVGVDALINGEVDAIYAFSTNEPYQLQSLGVDYNVIDPQDYGIDLYGSALFTSETELLEHPQRASKFLRASILGWEYAMANKPEIAQLIIDKYTARKSHPELLDEAHAIEALMLPELIEIGHTNKTRWKATAEILIPQGVNEKGLSLDGFIYDPRDFLDYPLPYKVLVIGLLLAVIAGLILSLYNYAMAAEIKTRTEAQKLLAKANQLILKQAYTDELSGMGNRRAFYEQAEAEIKMAKLDNTPMAALMIDIDHFKKINDQFGHAIGDEAIKQLGKVILDIVRSNDVQGRIGGEEFAIITTNTRLQGAEDLAERIRLATQNIEQVAGTKMVEMTISIGVAGFEPKRDDVHTMLARADEALYKAKDRGRNQVVISS